MGERTYAQSLQDDEDHRLALCGLSFDAAVEHELEDFEQRHYDFIFTRADSTAAMHTTGERRRAACHA